MDVLYDSLLVHPFKTISKLNKNDVVDGLYIAIAWLSRKFHHMVIMSQTGLVRWYASSMALGVVILIAIGWLS
jgi:NADH-quinone oxidoreductase subunit L